jgi:eukaryotic-like serine/threonine-protein kinase
MLPQPPAADRPRVHPRASWYNGISVQASTVLNDRYELVKPLASGGMAHVWLGRDQLLGRPVAIKILREEFTRKPDFQERFLKEAQAIAKLSHPNLVTVYDFGIQNEHYFMIMEYVEGENLKSFLRRAPGPALGAERAQPVDLWLDITIQVCEGLGLAHRAGLVHCDIKPQNILLNDELIAKVTDFGIARALGRSAGGEKEQAPPEEEEIVWGSPQYISPEQAAGESLTPASDVYSTGVMLFEMLTGRLPFPGKDPRTLSLQHLLEPAPSPRLLNPSLPEELDGIVLRALAKDPLQRYRNGEQMARVLKAYLTEHAEILSEGSPAAKEVEEEVEIDWKAVGLGFLDLIAFGSLIPLWVYVFFLYNPPGK